MNITLREFDPADLAEVHAMIARTIDASLAGVYSPPAVAHFHEHHTRDEIAKDAAQGHTLVLVEGGLIVGTGTLVDTHISRTYVDPACQGRGFGRRILETLESRARAEGIEALDLGSTVPARPFYERMGYRLVAARLHEFENGRQLDWFEMAKSLRPDSQ